MKEIRLNLNDSVKVKLTDHGKDIYFHRYDELDKKLGRKPTGHFPPVDEDGYTEFQLWQFIELYGKHIGITKPNVIRPLDIVFYPPEVS